jgi:hypothetical protein
MMPNPLYSQLNPQRNNMMSQIMEFRKTFRGNPQEIVQNMLNSGKITQDQINQYAKQATQIYDQMKGLI